MMHMIKHKNSYSGVIISVKHTNYDALMLNHVFRAPSGADIERSLHRMKLVSKSFVISVKSFEVTFKNFKCFFLIS